MVGLFLSPVSSLIPISPPFFVLLIVFSVMLGSGRVVKQGRPENACHVKDVRWTQCGHGGGSTLY